MIHWTLIWFFFSLWLYNPSIYKETNKNLRGKKICISKSGWHTFEVVHQQSFRFILVLDHVLLDSWHHRWPAPAVDSKPAVPCWWSTCGSSNPGLIPQSRALSATGKRIGKNSSDIFSSLFESLFHVGGKQLSSLPMMFSCRQS